MTENEQIKRLLTLIAVNNDQAAYKELFVLLYYRLKQFAFTILKSHEEAEELVSSHEEAEELVSDVFIKIWEKRSQLTTVESPRLYLYTTTKNLAITRINKQKKQISMAPDD